MNPSINDTDLSQCLDNLIKSGVIEVVEAEEHRFYHLTEQARSVFNGHDLFDSDEYSAVYEEISKPPEIQELEEVSRPEVSTSHN